MTPSRFHALNLLVLLLFSLWLWSSSAQILLPLQQDKFQVGESLRGFKFAKQAGARPLPVVVTHGMGDACLNPGMSQITKAIGEHLGVYSVCYGDGDDIESDAINGFLLNMNKQVEYFAKKVRADPALKNGFNAIGFSQGNLVIRGYIERINEPPVNSFISMHGPMMGVASIPHCDPVKGFVHKLCQEVVQLLSIAAYSKSIQNLLAQANYLRDPERMDEYLQTKFLPDLNNELHLNETYRQNFQKLKQLVLVQAKHDTMIYPKDSEWFGAFKDGGYESLIPMRNSSLYLEDRYGLRSLDEMGRVHFESTNGDHLRFSSDELFGIINKYWVSGATAVDQ